MVERADKAERTDRAEMAETARSDTARSDAAYLGYEYPASAGRSFADNVANHAPRDPVVLDATPASETRNRGNRGNNTGDADGGSNANFTTTPNADANAGANLPGNSDHYGAPDVNDVANDVGRGNQIGTQTGSEIGHDSDHDVGTGENNEDDIEVDNVRQPRLIYCRRLTIPTVLSADTPCSSGMAKTRPSETGNASYPMTVDKVGREADSAVCHRSSYGGSVLSDIMRHRYENGRRYHSYKEGRK